MVRIFLINNNFFLLEINIIKQIKMGNIVRISPNFMDAKIPRNGSKTLKYESSLEK